jgi:hypothetical protein
MIYSRIDLGVNLDVNLNQRLNSFDINFLASSIKIMREVE